jgi:subtilisin family serine protease
MGKNYDQLDIDERYEIYRLHQACVSLRQIGRLMGRSVPTISRELRRNALPGGEYKPGSVADKKKRIYSRANKGSYVDFTAKGVRIWVANSGKSGNYFSGTSFATPMVASLIAMEKARNNKSSPDSIRPHLKKLTIDLGSSGKDSVYGWGYIDKPSLCK